MADEVPSFDELPSFDDIPDTASQQSEAVPSFDALPSFDDLPDNQEASVAPTAANPVASEGAVATGVRTAARAVAPTAGGLLGAGAGGAAAGFLGAGPVGAFVGGVAGMVAGSMGVGYVQDKALEAAGFDDADQRAANAAEHPIADFVGGMAPAVATMSPAVAGGKVAQVLQRGAGAAFGGAFEAGQDYLNEGHVNPAKAAAAAVVGAVAPGVNRVGQKFVGAGERIVPGRPNRTANPAADAAHADVADPTEAVAVGDSSLAQPPTPATGDTTGNPQSAPQRSERNYAKDTGSVPGQGDMLTQGHMDPATEAALKSQEPEANLDTQPGQAAPEAVPPAAASAEAPPAAQPHVPAEAPAAEAPKVIEAGFPQEGEPVAVGANDATPLPAGTPERAAKAIKRSKLAETMPELKGETPINGSITDAQLKAGNYPKARTHDFGRPQAIETHAGDVRRGTGPDGTAWEHASPYDYGYFNKTIGKDKDHIDFARAPQGSAEAGDKHFIVDQKNAETGKFDEHKVFTYYKDEAAARQHYEAGFGDGKGAERLGAIKEVTRPELVKWLAKHQTKAATKPFSMVEEKGSPIGQKKDVRERAVFKDLVEKKPEMAEALAGASDEQIAKAIEGKRVRKYGVGTGASAGYPVDGIVNAEGKPITANTKAKAAERSAAHKQVQEWFTGSAPKSENETKDQLIARLIKNTPDMSGWKPTHKPAEWMLAREAQNFIKKPTPAAEKKFREAERLLRGAPEDVEAYRGGNRVEADIARSRRSGDEAVANAEAKNVDLGRNSVEDEMIANIDAKRKPGFDVPHEEAEAMVKPTPVKTKADLKELPRKTVDVHDSSLAKIDTKAIDVRALRRMEAEKLAGKKSAQAANVESEGAAAPVKQIKVTDKVDMQKYVDMLNAAEAKGKSRAAGLDALPAEREPSSPKLHKDLFDMFGGDERGSVDVGKIAADLKRWMNSGFSLKRSEPKSYRAKTLKTPHDEYVQSLSDDLQIIKKQDENYMLKNFQKLEAMPEELRKPEAMSQIYAARDKDSAHFPLPAGQTGTHIDNLPPRLKSLYDEHLKPLFDQNDEFVKAIREVDDRRVGADVANHIARIAKGDTSEYNMLKDRDDPTQPTYNGLSVNADAAKQRKFYALVGPDGRRHVISMTKDGFTRWDKYKPEKIKAPDFEFEDGGTFKAGPNDYTMRQATTKEIMDNARGLDGVGKPMRYYDNAGFSAAVANAQLGSMMRHLTELHRLTQTPKFKELSTTNGKVAQERDWHESNLPNMKGTYMQKDLKAVFDDFAGNKQGWYQQLNSNITKLLFWMPTAHINNVGLHWMVGRGWDWVTPSGYKSMVTDMPKAIASVYNQDRYQMRMRNEGAGLIYGSVITRRPMETIAKKLQIEMEREPGKWGPIADKIGVPLKALSRAVYDNSAKVMWAANDVFLTQRVMELQRKGKSIRDAVIEAERDIPNYRIPHTIAGDGAKGRAFAQFMQNPALTSFGRYHYGMFNSYANIIKDAVGKHAELGDRVDAAGKLFAMGLAAFVLYPVLDQMAKFVTGNEQGKAARRGPITIPTHLAEAAEGKQDVASFARGSITLPPLISAAIGALTNKDFRGKNIIEPGDVRKAVHGSPSAAGRVAVQGGEYAARSAISPLNTFAGAIQKGNKEHQNPAISVAKSVRDQALDIKDPSKAAIKYEKMTPIRVDRDARTRAKQGGSGPLESGYNKLFGNR